jgi:hypothetical protein
LLDVRSLANSPDRSRLVQERADGSRRAAPHDVPVSRARQYF